jgi:hypothetical protein
LATARAVVEVLHKRWGAALVTPEAIAVLVDDDTRAKRRALRGGRAATGAAGLVSPTAAGDDDDAAANPAAAAAAAAVAAAPAPAAPRRVGRTAARAALAAAAADGPNTAFGSVHPLVQAARDAPRDDTWPRAVAEAFDPEHTPAIFRDATPDAARDWAIAWDDFPPAQSTVAAAATATAAALTAAVTPHECRCFVRLSSDACLAGTAAGDPPQDEFCRKNIVDSLHFGSELGAGAKSQNQMQTRVLPVQTIPERTASTKSPASAPSTPRLKLPQTPTLGVNANKTTSPRSFANERARRDAQIGRKWTNKRLAQGAGDPGRLVALGSRPGSSLRSPSVIKPAPNQASSDFTLGPPPSETDCHVPKVRAVTMSTKQSGPNDIPVESASNGKKVLSEETERGIVATEQSDLGGLPVPSESAEADLKQNKALETRRVIGGVLSLESDPKLDQPPELAEVMKLANPRYQAEQRLKRRLALKKQEISKKRSRQEELKATRSHRISSDKHPRTIDGVVLQSLRNSMKRGRRRTAIRISSDEDDYGDHSEVEYGTTDDEDEDEDEDEDARVDVKRFHRHADDDEEHMSSDDVDFQYLPSMTRKRRRTVAGNSPKLEVTRKSSHMADESAVASSRISTARSRFAASAKHIPSDPKLATEADSLLIRKPSDRFRHAHGIAVNTAVVKNQEAEVAGIVDTRERAKSRYAWAAGNELSEAPSSGRKSPIGLSSGATNELVVDIDGTESNMQLKEEVKGVDPDLRGDLEDEDIPDALPEAEALAKLRGTFNGLHNQVPEGSDAWLQLLDFFKKGASSDRAARLEIVVDKRWDEGIGKYVVSTFRSSSGDWKLVRRRMNTLPSNEQILVD